MDGISGENNSEAKHQPGIRRALSFRRTIHVSMIYQKVQRLARSLSEFFMEFNLISLKWLGVGKPSSRQNRVRSPFFQ
jgi:hypothetical protein